jgi:hypothetical protein
MEHALALLRTRLESTRNRVRSAPAAILESALVVAAVCAAAAALGHATLSSLFDVTKTADAVWVVLRERIFLGAALSCFVGSYGAMEALVRPADGALLLSLPVGPVPRYAIATWDGLWRTSVAPLCLLAFVAPLAVRGDDAAPLLSRAAVLVVLAHAMAVASGLCAAALAGSAAASPHGHALKRALAGGWVAPERAPLLYAPALGGGTAAFLAVPLQTSLDDWPTDPAGAMIGAVIVAAAALSLLVLGAIAYRNSFARLGPLLEGVDSRYPLSPHAGDADERAPYGHAIIGRVPGLVGAIASRDLVCARRRHRAEPLLLAVMGGVCALLLVRLDASDGVTRAASIVIAMLSARIGVRLCEADVEVPWLASALALPWAQLLTAKLLVTLLHAAHAALPFSLVVGIFGAPSARAHAATLCILATIASSLLAPALALAHFQRATSARAVALPVAALAGLAAAWSPWLLALPLLVVATVVALLFSRRALARGIA